MSKLRRFVCAMGVILAMAMAMPCSGLAAQEPSVTGRPIAEGAFKQLPLRRDTDEGSVAALVYLGVIGIVALAVLVFARLRGRSLAPRALSALFMRAKDVRPGLFVVERRSLNSTCSICVVHWYDEEILLGCAAHGISVISTRRRAAADDQA